MKSKEILMSSSKRIKPLVVGGALSCLALLPKSAAAQVDTNPPLQNVMLLVDTSGSMEYAPDGKKVTCDQVDASLKNEKQGTSEKNRWTQLVEVLTGDVADFSCYTQDRTSDAFRDEYNLSGSNAADYNYHVPNHRILSGTGASACTIGRGVLDPNPFLWGTTPFKYHLWNSPSTACTSFQQSQTGLLDAYRDRIRFGLMTFDTSVEAGTGVAGLTSPDYATGVAGTWSYFLNWRSNSDCTSNTSCAKGRPAGCSTNTPVEVGARNAGAPPWEGRMVPFGSPVADIADVRTTNDHIQQVLTAVRPFGATPINGLLSDARDFLRSDDDDDYISNKTCDHATGIGCFGPRRDALVSEGCRKNFLILLTDGEPNLDLRPFCEGTSGGYDGMCPYADKSFEIVRDLATPGMGQVKTFVIGFAVSLVDTGTPNPVDCGQISQKGALGAGDTFDPQNICGANMNPKLSACCNLAKIAFYGGTTNAYFATNATELRTAMAAILRSIDGKVSTRTLPVFASAANEKLGGAYSFFSSFRADNADVWSGVLERQRTQCISQTTGPLTTITPKDLPIESDKGDKFSENVNAADGSHPRRFYTVLADADANGKRWSERSIRPTIAPALDGVGTASGVLTSGTISDFFAPKIPATAMQVTKASCTETPLPATDDDCAKIFMKWELAIDNTPYQKRLDAFGAIYHSTPVLVGAPTEFLRDESYTAFADAQFKRPPVLYTATTDGQLHAFKVDKSQFDTEDTFTINTKVNNELWSFIPPAALPRIPSQYPSSEQVIVDGVPVVKDVVFVRDALSAQNGGSSGQWHTVLVSGFGGGGTGYFAVDITKPVPKTGDDTTGPHLLWQLTKDDTGERLFGKRSGTPTIATLFFKAAGDNDPKEYAVAILPGGESDGPAPGQCDQQGSTALVDSSKLPRVKVRCWQDDPARSLTVVRLDTGEIVRSFRREADGPASVLPRSRDASLNYAALNAPISGQPVVFPATTGAVADRAFVGDRDGMLWRLDFSSSNPQDWKMQLFFDAFTGQAFDAGQPIATAPVLSVDRLGKVTVAFSTGDQETFLATTGMKNFVWSVVEDTSSSPPFKSDVRWALELDDGERVSGPMSLFASTLYYTTFKPPPIPPPTGQKCSAGQSQVCGVHYLLARTQGGTDGGAVPPSPINKGNFKGPDEACIQFGDSIVFGAGITQKPTCNDETTYNDPYLGNGNHTALTSVTAGKFELVVQTGPGGTNTQTGGEINTQSITLEPPMTTTRIDSWAAVVE
jgi:type IV pilus assembly protein PilY1